MTYHSLRHDIKMHQLRVKVQVRIHRGTFLHDEITIFDGRNARLNHHL